MRVDRSGLQVGRRGGSSEGRAPRSSSPAKTSWLLFSTSATEPLCKIGHVLMYTAMYVHQDADIPN
jgi:hypothetical protein